MISEAVETAKRADVVVAVLGEPLFMSGEASSRSTIGLFDNQVRLLKALKGTGKPVVLVLMNGRPLTLPWEDSNMDAILESWFPGTRGGPAIVDVLFGDANPSGKLTMSFPVNVGQIPIYYNHKNTGRPYDEKDKYRSKYLDVGNAPLYPFGYGLSYSTFKYGPTLISGASPSDSMFVSATVSNTSKRAGVETVQLYVRDLVGSITRPVKELKGFQKVALQPGETKEVTFELKREDLKFWNANLEHVFEPGAFKVFIGPNSKDAKDADLSVE
jgi:beta-glucosidase